MGLKTSFSRKIRTILSWLFWKQHQTELPVTILRFGTQKLKKEEHNDNNKQRSDTHTRCTFGLCKPALAEVSREVSYQDEHGAISVTTDTVVVGNPLVTYITAVRR